MREWLPRLALDRPVTVLMGFLALLVIGFIAWSRIPLQMMPSGFEPNYLWVWIPYANSTPTETDEAIIRPIEAQLGTVSGIRTLESTASARSASFSVEFYSSVDMATSYNEVVDRIERAMVDLPDDVDRYWVYKHNPNDSPILWIGVTFPDEMKDPYHVMTHVVQPQLERIVGVAAMDIWGVPEQIVRIDYDREKLFGHGVNLGDLQRRLGSDNFQMSGGQIQDDGQNKHIRSIARIESPAELARYPVKDDLVLKDIAQVGMGGALSSSIQRVNGLEAAALAIRKESNANTVEVAIEARRVLEALEEDPRAEGAEFFIFFDQGELISESVNNLTKTAMFGGLFALVILFAFLREWRMTLLIAFSIPFSLLITIGVLYFTGDSLNLLALMGL
ncbi:MAG: efflux RND transporter permease subunit, partial [Proteobacteria bacterium]|nr:efflux RND transporter permease subunit [Pseudomonadota bacterium]